MTAAAGKPSAEQPRKVANDLGLDTTGRHALSWGDLADLAADMYWQRRPEPSAIAFAEHRRRGTRAATPPEVWIARGGAA